jgi:allophanate hydrolase subunit 1
MASDRPYATETVRYPAEQPFLYQTGDSLRFVAIPEEDYRKILKEGGA